MKNRILILLIFLMVFSCKKNSKESIEEVNVSTIPQELFTVLAPEKTGILF